MQQKIRPKVLTKILTTLLLSDRLRGLSFTSDKLIVTLKSLNSGGDPLSVDRTVTTKLLLLFKIQLAINPKPQTPHIGWTNLQEKKKKEPKRVLLMFFSSAFAPLRVKRGHLIFQPSQQYTWMLDPGLVRRDVLACQMTLLRKQSI